MANKIFISFTLIQQKKSHLHCCRRDHNCYYFALYFNSSNPPNLPCFAGLTSINSSNAKFALFTYLLIYLPYHALNISAAYISKWNVLFSYNSHKLLIAYVVDIISEEIYLFFLHHVLHNYPITLVNLMLNRPSFYSY